MDLPLTVRRVPSPNDAPGIVERRSRFGFDETLAALQRKIAGSGMNIFARIDHRAAARTAGLAMPPTMLLFFGNAAKGTPLMLASPELALDLPLRLLVRRDDAGDTVIAYHPIAPRVRQAGAPDAAAQALEAALIRVVEAVAEETDRP